MMSPEHVDLQIIGQGDLPRNKTADDWSNDRTSWVLRLKLFEPAKEEMSYVLRRSTRETKLTGSRIRWRQKLSMPAIQRIDCVT